MTGFVKRFWGAAVSIAGVLGLYLGAVAIQATFWFWLALIAALAIAATPSTLAFFRKHIRRYLDYPELADRVELMKSQIQRLETIAQETGASRDSLRDTGISEGHAQFLGFLLGNATSPPVLIGIHKSDERLMLVAQYSLGQKPMLQARFTLAVATMAESRGSVEVVNVNTANQRVLLKHCDNLAPAFWKHLHDRADFDTSAPNDVELIPYTLDKSVVDSLAAIGNQDPGAFLEGS
jgi:hypothetical protein